MLGTYTSTGMFTGYALSPNVTNPITIGDEIRGVNVTKTSLTVKDLVVVMQFVLDESQFRHVIGNPAPVRLVLWGSTLITLVICALHVSENMVRQKIKRVVNVY